MDIKVKHHAQAISFTTEHENLLICLEKHQVKPAYHCREGFCGACRCKLNSGTVSYPTEPLAFIRKGEILLCSAVPETDLELELP